MDLITEACTSMKDISIIIDVYFTDQTPLILVRLVLT